MLFAETKFCLIPPTCFSEQEQKEYLDIQNIQSTDVTSQITSLMLEVLCDKKSACWITFILQGSITFGKMCSSNCSSEVASIEQASFIESLKLSL